MLSRLVTSNESYNRTLHRSESGAANAAANKAVADKEEKNDLVTILQDRYEKSGARAKAVTYAPAIARVAQSQYVKEGEPARAATSTAVSAADLKSRIWSVKSNSSFWCP